MDIVAHGIWAGIGLAFAFRYKHISKRNVLVTITFSIAPDTLHMLPVIGLAATQPDGLETLIAYAFATPVTEPTLPHLVELTAHHLHCVMHSAVVVTVMTLIFWLIKRSVWLPLLGWWLHVVIDIFTHSADFYPSPLLYPFSYHGFDGIAWNTPWFMVANYIAILIVIAALFLTSSRNQPR